MQVRITDNSANRRCFSCSLDIDLSSIKVDAGTIIIMKENAS